MTDCGIVPRVTVVVPAFNVEAFIQQTIESVLRQTFRDFEIVVVDDGSIDGTAQAVAGIQGPIRLITQESRGPSAARNSGIRCSRSPLVAFLDGDDMWTPDYLQNTVGFLDSHPDVAAVFPDAEFFGEPETEGARYQELFPTVEPVSVRGLVSGRCHVFTSVTLRRETLDAVGPFDEGLRYCEDLDLWLRISHAGFRIDLISVPLARYRRRSDSLSRSTKPMLGGLLAVLEKLDQLSLTDAERQAVNERREAVRADWLVEGFKDELISGEWSSAFENLKHANSYHRRLKYSLACTAYRLAPGVAGPVLRSLVKASRLP